MNDCCDDCAAEALGERQRGTLLAVLAINGLMFVVMVIAAQFAKSSALFADSVDNLGDALTYGLSLMVVGGTVVAKARVALVKGCLILLAAFVVAAQIGYRFIVSATPIFELMGLFSLVALAANSVCLLLLWRHRHEDLNMSSVWECSRNDIAGNLSVFLAAGLVWAVDSSWPDVLVATALVMLLLRSAARVITRSVRETRVAA